MNLKILFIIIFFLTAVDFTAYASKYRALKEIVESIKKSNKKTKTITEVTTGSGAVLSATEAIDKSIVMKQKEEILEEMKKRGIKPTSESLYSIYLKLYDDKNALYWADLVGRPDVYILMKIEGEEHTYLVSDIYDNVKGQPIMETVLTKSGISGRKCMIIIYDSDSTSNRILNQLLQNTYKFQAGVNTRGITGIPLSLTAEGDVKLLDKNVTLNSDDFIAYAEFKIPGGEHNK